MTRHIMSWIVGLSTAYTYEHGSLGWAIFVFIIGLMAMAVVFWLTEGGKDGGPKFKFKICEESSSDSSKESGDEEVNKGKSGTQKKSENK